MILPHLNLLSARRRQVLSCRKVPAEKLAFQKLKVYLQSKNTCHICVACSKFRISLISNVTINLHSNVRKALYFTDGKLRVNRDIMIWPKTHSQQFQGQSRSISKLNSEFTALSTVLHSHTEKKNLHPKSPLYSQDMFSELTLIWNRNPRNLEKNQIKSQIEILNQCLVGVSNEILLFLRGSRFMGVNPKLECLPSDARAQIPESCQKGTRNEAIRPSTFLHLLFSLPLVSPS